MNNGSYRKNQFNEVTIAAYLAKSVGNVANGDVIAVMPLGYFPKTVCYYPCIVFNNSTGAIAPSLARIELDGRVIVGGYNISPGFNVVVLCVSYQSAS